LDYSISIRRNEKEIKRAGNTDKLLIEDEEFDEKELERKKKYLFDQLEYLLFIIEETRHLWLEKLYEIDKIKEFDNSTRVFSHSIAEFFYKLKKKDSDLYYYF
jgi:hypothetical protein